MTNRPSLLFASEKSAATLLDMQPAEFLSLVEQGALPGPEDVGGLPRWRVATLDAINSGQIMEQEFEV